MSRSSKKGPYVDERLMKKVSALKKGDHAVIKTWARNCTIAPEMVGFTFAVHTGKAFVDVLVKEEMVGHRLGEFAPTKKFLRHGGKMQKQQEAAAVAKESEKKDVAK